MDDDPALSPLGPNDRNSWRAGPDAADLVRPQRPPRPVWIRAEPKRVRLDLARTALIVVDMQNDFCHPDGWLAGIGVDVAATRAAIAPLVDLVPKCRAAGVPVIWLNWGARADLANIPPVLMHVYDGNAEGVGLGAPMGPRKAPVLQKGSWSAQIVDELAVDDADIRVDKHRMSGFWDTPLDSILRNLDIRTTMFAGVNADQCVLHTLADANFHGYDTIMIEEASATASPEYCMQATVFNVRQIFGFTVTAGALAASLEGDLT
jgi:nicotinamidase-related amidase